MQMFEYESLHGFETDIDILLGHLVYCHIQILIFLIQNLYMTIIEE